MYMCVFRQRNKGGVGCIARRLERKDKNGVEGLAQPDGMQTHEINTRVWGRGRRGVGKLG